MRQSLCGCDWFERQFETETETDETKTFCVRSFAFLIGHKSVLHPSAQWQNLPNFLFAEFRIIEMTLAGLGWVGEVSCRNDVSISKPTFLGISQWTLQWKLQRISHRVFDFLTLYSFFFWTLPTHIPAIINTAYFLSIERIKIFKKMYIFKDEFR